MVFSRLESCRKYFTQDAWNVLQALVKVIRKRPSWYCGRQCTCQTKDETQSSVICESCLTWFYFSCLSLRQPPNLDAAKCGFAVHVTVSVKNSMPNSYFIS